MPAPPVFIGASLTLETALSVAVSLACVGPCLCAALRAPPHGTKRGGDGRMHACIHDIPIPTSAARAWTAALALA